MPALTDTEVEAFCASAMPGKVRKGWGKRLSGLAKSAGCVLARVVLLIGHLLDLRFTHGRDDAFAADLEVACRQERAFAIDLHQQLLDLAASIGDHTAHAADLIAAGVEDRGSLVDRESALALRSEAAGSGEQAGGQVRSTRGRAGSRALQAPGQRTRRADETARGRLTLLGCRLSGSATLAIDRARDRTDRVGADQLRRGRAVARAGSGSRPSA